MSQFTDEIISSITQFKIPGWINVSVDQIKVTPIGNGLVNTTLKVERTRGKSDADDNIGPISLVYKKHGGNVYAQQVEEMGYNVNSPMVQSLVFYEMSQQGWGPKLYGLFDGGRVEEFVDCHTLSGQEAFTPEISRGVAKAYARFHSLKLPIDQQHFDLMTSLLPSVEASKKQLAAFLDSKDIEEPNPLMCYKRIYKFPFHEEANWINSIRSKIKQRTVFSTMDPNYLNRLVRNEKLYNPNATRILIIDFDTTAYSDRGYDLGGHFVLRMFGEGGFNFSGLPHPNEEQQMAFLTAHLEEVEKLFDDFDKGSRDSLDNLMLECEFNALVYIIALLVAYIKTHTLLQEKPGMASFIDPLLNLFKELKEKFCAKHPNLVN